ncbi:hypothetical protein H5202_15825 [Shewanella sp. SG41-4]|uniref:hypothetical protein n=1 Tax=Shewanella sp. SG41-4 TaxID=2760976 RepID=UPI001600656C|nr:hypothetical protein [Shewanella sp. SG41-4]MBB1440116.1 hypothetical protein [Shewanella sp. SG41-4]
MSQIHDARYRLEREHRQKIAEERVRNTTSSFIDRYQNELASLQEQGLVEFVQVRYDGCLSELMQIRAELDSNPFNARERSKSLGNEIYSLRNMARQIKQQVEEAQYQNYLKELEARAEVEKQREVAISVAWTQELRNWTDKLSLNLMLKEIKALEQQVFSEKSVKKEGDLLAKLHKLKLQGLEKAAEHRVLVERLSQSSTNRDFANAIAEVVSTSLPTDQAQVISEQFDTIFSDNPEDAIAQLQKIEQLSDQADKQIEDEAIRKETVKAIFNTLKTTGFAVQKPKLVINKEGKSEVVIAASRPAGNRAQFEIRLDGSCTYKFENYKGQTCKKDIEQVLPKLSEIYGVDLSDSRVLWSNPDDEDAEMKPIPSQTMNSKG